MVHKISEIGESAPKPKGAVVLEAARSGKELWAFLRPRLRMIVRMQAQWGDMHKLYKSYPVSMFTQLPLQSCIRDPESNFSLVWDLLQILFLLYVAITVPFYAGFDIDFDQCHPMWYIELIVDLYFIIDLGLNFRTAYVDKNGVREDRPRRIAIEFISNAAFKNKHFDPCVILGDANAIAELAKCCRRVAAASQAYDGGHTRVVPTIDMVFFNQLNEPSLTQHSVFERKSGKFDLLRVTLCA